MIGGNKAALKKLSRFLYHGDKKKKLLYLCVFPLPSAFSILTYNSSFGGIKKPLLLSLGSFGTTIMGPESFQIHIRTY